MMRELLLDENIELYQELLSTATYKSIYHELDYLLAEEAAEKYNIYLYLYEDGEKYAVLPSVKRCINDLEWCKGLNLDRYYYDIKTPHEFSGVMAYANDSILIRKFYSELGKFCVENSIVYGFIRFNPYTEEHLLAEDYDILMSGEQVWVDCLQGELYEGISKSCKRNYNLAIKRGVYRITEKGLPMLSDFMNLYRDSMDALKAKEFFYFSEEYFNRLYDSDITEYNMIYDSETNVALAGTILLLDKYNKILYYHLSCRNRLADNKYPMEYMIMSFIEDARRNGYEKVHISGAPNENLLAFKKRFSDKVVKYYIGSRIYNLSIYEYLCHRFLEIYPEEKDNSFKPLYRCKE